MPPHHVLDLLYCVASFLVGGALTWRVLGRARRGHYRKLAQELTEGVHERCSAYQRLEDRIDRVIAGFDQREAEMSDGSSAGMHAAEIHPAEIHAPEIQTPEVQTMVPPDFPASAAGAGVEPAESSDALSWMDECDGAGQPISAEGGETSFVGLPVAGEPVVDSTETVVDRFAQSLQVLQRQKSDELERQRGWTLALEVRIQALESSIQELARRQRGDEESRGAQGSDGDAAESAPAAAAKVDESSILEQSLQAIHERIARSEREFAAWHAQYEGLARERLAAVASARELSARMNAGVQRPPEVKAPATSARPRAAEPARPRAEEPTRPRAEEPAGEIEKLPPAMARPRRGPSRPIFAAPRIAAAMEARFRGTEPTLPSPVAPEPGPAARGESSAIPETARAAAEAARLVAALDDLPGLLEATQIESEKTDAAEFDSPSQISQLMKNLEIARGEAETYRRRLQEQSSQFTAAYAMLERIRPFMEGLESAFAARGREGERRS